MFLVFWALGITLWRASGLIFPVLNFGYIGAAAAVRDCVRAVAPPLLHSPAGEPRR
jgi:hypothetical protein